MHDWLVVTKPCGFVCIWCSGDRWTMSNRTGVAVFEYRNDHLCHMANPADDTLAELARIVGSGATLSPASSPAEKPRPDAPRLVQTAPVDRRMSEQPAPEAPVVAERHPTMMMDVIDAPHSRIPETARANVRELPVWAQATSESAPRFDFDLQNRLQEAFGTPVASEKSAFERVVDEETDWGEPEPDFVAPHVAEVQTFETHAYSNDADELDAALSAELDRVLADEMAESDADFASPELKAKDDFEAELARMFLPDPAIEPAPAKPVAEAMVEMARMQPVHHDDPAPIAADAGFAATRAAPERQAPVIVDPIFAEADVANAAAFEETATASPGRGKTIAMAIAAVALLGGTAAIALNFVGGENGPPPIIMADNTPAKERPADPGGENVPNQDQAVYKSVEGRSNADLDQPTLLESEETPIQVTNVGIADSSAANALAPRTVRTVTVRPDGTIVGSTDNGTTPRAVSVTNVAENRFGNETASAAANPIGPEAETIAAAPVTPVPVVPEPVAVAEPEVAAPDIVAPVVPTPAPKPVEVAKVEPAPAPEPEPTPAASSPYKVQISSQRSEAAAKSSYNTLSQRYASVIGGKGVDYQRTDIPGKGIYYRVRIPAASSSEANNICSRLKSAGGSCFVTR